MGEQNFKADDIFKAMQAQSNFEILPCDNISDIDSKPGYVKMNLTDSQKIQVSGLMQQIPMVVTAGAINNISNTAAEAAKHMGKLYELRFPNGVNGTLVQLQDGGYGSMLRGARGWFSGHASYHLVDTSSANQIAAQTAVQTTMLCSISALSIASGQYFLSKINNEMKMINQSIDKILEFLYGDKKAELMSEINFVKYAYENYNYIMSHSEQRAGIIAGLVEAKKVAMKDIEFYVGDLNSTINSNKNDVSATVDQAYSIKDSLELSLQLYTLSNVLEVYYSQNFEPEYIKYIENDVTHYISKCEKRILSDFSALRGTVANIKDKPFVKLPKNKILARLDKTIDELKNREESPLNKSLRSSLAAINKRAVYYISKDGNVYMKAA